MNPHPILLCRVAAEPAPALDLVVAAHKALRRFMFDTLVQIGALDVTDGAAIERALNGLDRLLAVLNEPRQAWRPTMQSLRHGAFSQRRSVAAALYRALSQLVQRQLLRLQQDEPQDGVDGVDDVDAAERLAALDDDELRDALHWMRGALTPQELAALLDALQGGATNPRAALAA